MAGLYVSSDASMHSVTLVYLPLTATELHVDETKLQVVLRNPYN